MEECSGLLGVSVGIVWRCLRDFDLPVRPQGGRIGKNSPIHDGVLPNDKVAYSKIWRKKNRARLREYQVDYLANHPNRDGLILHYRMSTMVRYTLKRGQGKNRRAWLTMVPYTIEELKAHLLTTIPPDHTWADFVSGELEIDHKIPQSVFHFSSPADQDFQRCWALENLQLLPSIANKSKGNRLSAPFQPTLL